MLNDEERIMKIKNYMNISDNDSIIKKIKGVYILFSLAFVLIACGSTSSTTVSDGTSISKYQFVVFGGGINGDAELDDILLIVQNEIAKRLHVVNSTQAIELVNKGYYVLTPQISAKSEKWDGGHAYITISFFDYNTNMIAFVVKSSGIGMSIDEDKDLALKAIKKELDKVLPVLNK